MTSACSRQTLGGEEDLEAIDQKQAVGIAAIDNRFKNIRFKATAGTHRVGVTFKQKTAAEHLDILHAFNPVSGMAQNHSGAAFSDGYRLSNVEIKGPISQGRRQRHAEPPQAVRVPRRPTRRKKHPCAKQILAHVAPSTRSAGR